jgi:regulatory protein
VTRRSPDRKPPPPLGEETLRALAMHYVSKYATTSGKLASYLARKLRERGWAGGSQPDIEALIARFAELGFIDDAQFAQARSRALARRGFGARRLDADLRAGGIAEADAVGAREHMSESRFAAAENFARRKRIGPFSEADADPDKKRKQLQAFLRAGHDFEIARRFVYAAPGGEVEEL